jgi:hypothetical protein
MRGHFLYLRFKIFPMTLRTLQCEVFWALLSNSKHLGVPKDSKSPTLELLGFTPTLGQSGVATSIVPQIKHLTCNMIVLFIICPIYLVMLILISCDKKYLCCLYKLVELDFATDKTFEQGIHSMEPQASLVTCIQIVYATLCQPYPSCNLCLAK